MKRWRLGVFVGLLLGVAACVPATVPSQLAHTPGPGVTVNNGRYANSAFSLNYPEGWRVVSSAASADTASVMLIAPEDAALIVIGEDAQTPTLPHAESLRTESQVKAVNGRRITLILSAPAAEWTPYHAAFIQVVESLQAAH